MLQFTDVTGLIGIASALAVTTLQLPGARRLATVPRAVLLAAVFVLVLVPFGAMPLAAYVRGATGDLSITAVVLLWIAMLRPLIACAAKPRRVLLMLVASAAVIFYPLALGAGMADPYRIGYGEPLFVLALLMIALIAWFRRFNLVALCIALAMCAWVIGWYESGNLWDYLIDPFVSIYALWKTVAGLKVRPGP